MGRPKEGREPLAETGLQKVVALDDQVGAGQGGHGRGCQELALEPLAIQDHERTFRARDEGHEPIGIAAPLEPHALRHAVEPGGLATDRERLLVEVEGADDPAG